MKRLFFPSLLLLLLLFSCKATEAPTLPSAGESKEVTLENLKNFYQDNSSDSRAIYNYAYALSAEKEYKISLLVLTPVMEEEEPPLRFAQLYSYNLIKLYRYNEGVKLLKQILSYDSANIEVRLQLASILSILGRGAEAKAEALTVLNYDKTNSSAIKILSLYSDFYKALLGEEETKEKASINLLSRPNIDKSFTLDRGEKLSLLPLFR